MSLGNKDKGLFGSVYKFLRLGGDGTINMTGAHSLGTPGLYQYKPTELEVIQRIVVQVRDNATLAAEKYGGLAELTNGIMLELKDSEGTTILDLLDGRNINSLADWGGYCYDVNPSAWGNGDNFAQIRWTFGKSGQPLRIDGQTGEYLQLTVQDDLSALVGHTAMLQGMSIG